MKRRTFTAALVGAMVAPVAAIKGMGKGAAVKAAGPPQTVTSEGMRGLLVAIDCSKTPPGRYVYSEARYVNSPLRRYHLIDFGGIKPANKYVVVDVVVSSYCRSANGEEWFAASDPFIGPTGNETVMIVTGDSLYYVA